EAFVTPSGARMRFPLDTSLGAGAAATINSRCDAEYRIDFLANLRRRNGPRVLRRTGPALGPGDKGPQDRRLSRERATGHFADATPGRGWWQPPRRYGIHASIACRRAWQCVGHNQGRPTQRRDRQL